MGKLNTAANISSAFSNRAAARSGAETSASVGKLASSDRQRELRERGLITHRSTPRDIALVEDTLAAQMRGRMILQGSSYWNRRPYTLAVAIGALGLLLSFPVLGGSRPWAAIFILLPTVAVAALLATKTRREEERRAELIASADWDDDGCCIWCGTTEPHIVEGEEEHPRIAHAHELELAVGEPLYVEIT